MARRGGYRPRRYVTRGDAAVWCPGGRWGPRRTRVTECRAVLRAEDLYTELLKDKADSVRPGAAGSFSCTIGGRNHTAGWEIRQNAVWTRGRVFLRCPRCMLRCTRLYLPLETSYLACRRCWGLTYTSRTLQNYKNTPWGRGVFARMFGTSRDWASLATYEKRQELRERSKCRWEGRRGYLRRS